VAAWAAWAFKKARGAKCCIGARLCARLTALGGLAAVLFFFLSSFFASSDIDSAIGGVFFEAHF
jgi:hypothetical protein